MTYPGGFAPMGTIRCRYACIVIIPFTLFHFIYVELKRHRPGCLDGIGRHRRCVGYSPYSRLTHLFRRCSL